MTELAAPMNDEQRKALARTYFKLLDRGEDFFVLFADDAQVYVPKWGLANGTAQIKQAFAAMGSTLGSITHDHAYFNYIQSGDSVVVEGTSYGSTAEGVTWRAGVTLGGRFCNVFEISGGLIHRLFIYLDPDYGDQNTGRYPWLAGASS